MATTLIKKGYLPDPCLSFGQADILIEDDLITRVGSNIDCRADTVINALDKVILPGLISARAHVSSLRMRGLLTDNLPLELWLLYNRYAEMTKTSLRDLYASTAIVAVDLLKTGTASVLGHGPKFSPDDCTSRVDATANAFNDAGIKFIKFPSDEAPKFVEIAYDGRWARAFDKAPEDVARLRELLGLPPCKG